MTAINHAMTGAIIGLVNGNPIVALPAAVLSHLVCDAIPHFGLGAGVVASRKFRYYLMIEALLCLSLVVTLAVLQPAHWLLACFTAFVATSPDFLSMPRFLSMQAGKSYKPSWIHRFLSAIQWFEKPIGAVVELAWAGAALYLLSSII